MSFEYLEIRVVTPFDPLEGHRYVEPVNNEGQGDHLDHIYNIMSSRDDYINPKTNGKLSWRSVISGRFDSGEALENWQDRMHEIYMRRCVRITRSVGWVGGEARELPTYEGFLNLAYFLEEFEANVIES